MHAPNTPLANKPKANIYAECQKKIVLDLVQGNHSDQNTFDLQLSELFNDQYSTKHQCYFGIYFNILHQL
jgi:hypothetical protein